MSKAIKLDGVLGNHTNNHTMFTREAYAPKMTYDEIPELELDKDSEYTILYNINPGLYKINIDGTIYAILIHDKLEKYDKLVIKSQYDIFEIYNLQAVNVIPYKLHDGLEVSEYGHRLKHTLNDNIDIIYCTGKTYHKLTKDFNNPMRFKHLSDLNIRIRNRKGQVFNTILPLKTNLKSIGQVHKDNYIYDKLYLDSYKKRALFEYRLTSIKLTGFEQFIEYEDMCDNKDYHILFFKCPNIKEESYIESSHFISGYITDIYSTNNNIIASSANGIYLKIHNSIYGNSLTEFKTRLNNMYSKGQAIEIIYQNKNSTYQNMILDNYNIRLFYGYTDIVIIPPDKLDDLNYIYNITNLPLDVYVNDRLYYKDIYDILPLDNGINKHFDDYLLPIDAHMINNRDYLEYIYNIKDVRLSNNTFDNITNLPIGDITIIEDYIDNDTYFRDIFVHDSYIDKYDNKYADMIELPIDSYSINDNSSINSIYAISLIDDEMNKFSKKYDDILLPLEGYSNEDNSYMDNIYVSGDLNVRAVYFYKYLNLD